MKSESELAVLRRAYAEKIVASVNLDNPALVDAFADVRREDFLGPGPWQVFRWTHYEPTPDADPAHLYTDDVFAIAAERRINNGQPSLHAGLIGSAAPKEGEHVVHIGAGVGYFSAVLAHMVGRTGRVTAIEYEPDLAARAKANCRCLANVTVVQGDGAQAPFDVADVIYVNAGATRPADAWLDRLKDGGRLILPLTANRVSDGLPIRAATFGAVFRIERRGDEYVARMISPVAIYPCAGMRDEASDAILARAFEAGRWGEVTRLYRSGKIPEERCWLRGPDWCLAYS